VTLQRTDQDELDKLSQRLRASGDTQLDAIVNVAGGWAGGNLESQTLIKDFDNMVHVNLRSAFAAAYLASRHLSQRGLLVLTGAAAALNASPTMLAYGASKAAVHHLVRSLAEPGSGLPADAAVAAILPITIDTPSNRAAMPKADFSTWTPPEDIARTILSWTEDGKRPRSGGLYRFDTAANKTTVALVP
jgi:dihydropteridine reductase